MLNQSRNKMWYEITDNPVAYRKVSEIHHFRNKIAFELFKSNHPGLFCVGKVGRHVCNEKRGDEGGPSEPFTIVKTENPTTTATSQ